MKKSNKLLLTGLLTMILPVTGMHIALFAKYKNGHYTVYRREDKNAGSMQTLSNVSFVTIRNVRNVNVQFNTNAQVQKGREDYIQYEQKGDSLVITGRPNESLSSGGSLIINLPDNVSLFAVNSVINFQAGKETVENNPVIYLQNSHAVFSDFNSLIRFAHVKVIATDNSIATFHHNVQVDHLEAQLNKSALEFNEGNANQLSIITDSVSRISLQSKLLLKAKISQYPNNP